MKLEKFCASDSWILNFKQHYSIVSRKVTKFVTYKHLRNQKELLESAEKFVAEGIKFSVFEKNSHTLLFLAKVRMLEYPNEMIMNSDQSGFRKELHSERSLAAKGEKDMEKVAVSEAATTHSYTIQPIITKDGKLLKPMLIILQVKDGEFGPIVIFLFS